MKHCVSWHGIAAKHWCLMLRQCLSASAARDIQGIYTPVCRKMTRWGLTQEVPVFHQRVSGDHYALAEGQVPVGSTSRSIQERLLDLLT
jgi:hypothetical protein